MIVIAVLKYAELLDKPFGNHVGSDTVITDLILILWFVLKLCSTKAEVVIFFAERTFLCSFNRVPICRFVHPFSQFLHGIVNSSFCCMLSLSFGFVKHKSKHKNNLICMFSTLYRITITLNNF